jgi:hypothetical protein
MMTLSSLMVSSFLLQPKTTRRLSSAAMVGGGGGKGWDNASYLDNLGGDENDRQEATQKYQEFSEARASFMERQQKHAEQMSQTEKGRKFLAQYQKQQQEKGMDDDASLLGEDEIVVGSGGGTRMAAVMARARQQQQGKSGAFPRGMQQFEQKLAIPLYEDEEEGSID